MKPKQAFISFETGYSSAVIDVPGLGAVEIKGFISDETKERIAKDAEENMRARLDAATGFGKFGRWNDL